MDIKIAGVSVEIMRAALQQARDARLFVLTRMREAIEKPRPELSPYAPRFVTIKIRTEKIREIIGPGGKEIGRASCRERVWSPGAAGRIKNDVQTRRNCDG